MPDSSKVRLFKSATEDGSKSKQFTETQTKVLFIAATEGFHVGRLESAKSCLQEVRIKNRAITPLRHTRLCPLGPYRHAELPKLANEQDLDR